MRSLVVAVLVLAASPVAAQGPNAIAGYVIDLRGATAGLPNEAAFFPGIPVDTVVPARGFGFDVGGHVYLFTLGPSRLGVGVNYVSVRGTSPGIATNVRTVVPQVSFNFGTADGWSYLSAGLGRASVRTTVDTETGALTSEFDGLSAVNYGGGARWFLRRRLAVGFDVRFHRVSGPPRANLLALAVGFSVR